METVVIDCVLPAGPPPGSPDSADAKLLTAAVRTIPYRPQQVSDLHAPGWFGLATR